MAGENTNPSLEESIASAVEADTNVDNSQEEGNEENQETEESSEETGEAAGGEETTEENEEESVENDEEEDDSEGYETNLTAEQLQRAENLYNALNGENAVANLEFLAKQAGFELKSIQTEDKPAEATGEDGDLSTLLQDILGDDYKFLNSKVIKGIEAYDKVIQKRLSAREEADATREAEATIKERLTVFSKKHDLSLGDDGEGDDVTNEMNNIAKSLPFTGQTIEEFDNYLDVLYQAASNKINKVADRVQKINKINRNLGASETGAAGTTSEEKGGSRRGPAKPTLEEALNAAVNSDNIFVE